MSRTLLDYDNGGIWQSHIHVMLNQTSAGARQLHIDQAMQILHQLL